MNLVLLYLVIGFFYETYIESEALASGDIDPDILLDYPARILEVLKWPYNVYLSFREN